MVNQEHLEAFVGQHMPGSLAGAELKFSLKMVDGKYRWISSIYSPGVYGAREKVLSYGDDLEKVMQETEQLGESQLAIAKASEEEQTKSFSTDPETLDLSGLTEDQYVELGMSEEEFSGLTLEAQKELLASKGIVLEEKSEAPKAPAKAPKAAKKGK